MASCGFLSGGGQDRYQFVMSGATDPAMNKTWVLDNAGGCTWRDGTVTWQLFATSGQLNLVGSPGITYQANSTGWDANSDIAMSKVGVNANFPASITLGVPVPPPPPPPPPPSPSPGSEGGSLPTSLSFVSSLLAPVSLGAAAFDFSSDLRFVSDQWESSGGDFEGDGYSSGGGDFGVATPLQPPAGILPIIPAVPSPSNVGGLMPPNIGNYPNQPPSSWEGSGGDFDSPPVPQNPFMIPGNRPGIDVPLIPVPPLPIYGLKPPFSPSLSSPSSLNPWPSRPWPNPGPVTIGPGAVTAWPPGQILPGFEASSSHAPEYNNPNAPGNATNADRGGTLPSPSISTARPSGSTGRPHGQQIPHSAPVPTTGIHPDIFWKDFYSQSGQGSWRLGPNGQMILVPTDPGQTAYMPGPTRPPTRPPTPPTRPPIYGGNRPSFRPGSGLYPHGPGWEMESAQVGMDVAQAMTGNGPSSWVNRPSIYQPPLPSAIYPPNPNYVPGTPWHVWEQQNRR